MNVKMRLVKQSLSLERTEDVFKGNTSGVLSLSGTDGYPYGVPVSYFYKDKKVYIHGAKQGYKHECIERSNKACFTVIDADDIVAEEFTTYYRSAVAFGKIRIIEGSDELRSVMEELSDCLTPNDEEKTKETISGSFDRLRVLCLEIEEMTGKEAIELIKEEK